MIKRALQPEQWQVLHRLRSVGCPVDYEHLPTPLQVFAEPWATQILPMSGGTGIALLVRVVASTSITIRRFRLRTDWLKDEISWLRFCNQHQGDSQKHYCFQACSRGNAQFSSEEVLNHRTLHRGVLKRCGFLSGFLLGTFHDALPPTGIGTKLQATLSIEDLFEHEYRFPIVLLDHTNESDYEDWMCQRASAIEGTVMPLTGNKDKLL
ncbi:MAG: hypothetical protein WB799_07530 [Candidatus Sulfotelmatobacter sp.]